MHIKSTFYVLLLYNVGKKPFKDKWLTQLTNYSKLTIQYTISIYYIVIIVVRTLFYAADYY